MIGTLAFGAAALLLTSYTFSYGIDFTTPVETLLLALQVSLVLGVLNTTVKPILKIVTIPLHLVTFGLFSFAINGFIIVLATKVIPEFHIPSFLQAVYFAFVFTFLMRVYHLIARDDD